MAGIEVKVGDEGTFYLNKAGQIELKDAKTTKSDNYGYIYTMDVDDKGMTSDGLNTTTATAYMVLADGTKASYDVAIDVVSKADAAKEGEDRTEGVYFEDTDVKVGTGVIAYSVNSDDELVYEDAEDNNLGSITGNKIDKDNVLFGTKKIDNKDTKIRATSETEFVFFYKDGSKMKVATATSYKNVSIDAATAKYVVADDDGYALYVFVNADNGELSSDELIAVLLDAEASEGENEDGDTIYTYAVAIDGEETELTFKNDTKIGALDAGTAFTYEMDGDYAKDSTVAALKRVSVVAVNGDYVIFNDGVRKDLGTETVYTITMEYEDEAAYKAGDVDTVTVTEGGKIEKDDNVIYTLDDGDLDVVFVIDYVY